jgi:predicted small lipoprotein YifL
MAIFGQKSALALAVLSSLIVCGCGYKQDLDLGSSEKVIEASAQLSCQFGSAYNSKTKKCESLVFFEDKDEKKLEQSISTSNTSEKPSVIDRVVADKAGVGCVKLTEHTKLPLDLQACKKLARKNGRLMAGRVNLGQIVTLEAPVVYKGEEWFLYKDEKGVLIWKIPQGKDF